PDVVQVDLHLPAFDLVEQRADAETLRVTGLQVPRQVGDGPSRVDDVLDEDDVPVLDRDREVRRDLHHARGGGGRAVAGHRDEVGREGGVDRADEVREEDDGALQDADEQGVLVRVIARERLAEFADPLDQLLPGDQHPADGLRHSSSASDRHGTSRELGGAPSPPTWRGRDDAPGSARPIYFCVTKAPSESSGRSRTARASASARLAKEPTRTRKGAPCPAPISAT